MKYPEQVKVVEVGPRDGLQSEPAAVDTVIKIELINRLSTTGLAVVEAASFVSPAWIPQLADAEQVWAGIERRDNMAYPVLVPNMQGLERALAIGVKQIAVFTAASETFCRKNINCSIDESLTRYAPVIRQAREAGIAVRAYISCVLGCPYEGDVDVNRVVDLSRHFTEAGCYEISLGDTIGTGTALQAREMVANVAEGVPVSQLALHFHDTRGQALANILACLELGVSVVDAAVAGLGGCPYAKGASGNVATEDLVYMLHGMGIRTGVDLEKLIDTGRFITKALARENRSKVGLAGVPEYGSVN
ncbi:MAG: hydroxymethylglutaryl-CoA lyase [Candidatus Thiodiazotropha sp. (ex Monitilora ramsayi)]|nr:hydroxymethylglutaryl-CoA lyase [Candidatus Thiodiazotropha sp. (ex Monitilora ramsayi)]